MSLKEALPQLVGKLSDIMGQELAEKIVSVASEATTDEAEAEALIVEGLNSLSYEQRHQTIEMLESYSH